MLRLSVIRLLRLPGIANLEQWIQFVLPPPRFAPEPTKV